MKKILFLILLLATTAYATEWNYTGTSYSLRDAAPTAIRYVGTNWWELGTSGTVYKYNSTWGYTGTSYALAEDSFCTSIEWDGTNWWMLGANNDRVYQYSALWVYTGVNYSVAAQDNNPQGIDWNGTNWLMVGDQNDKVYIYNSTWGYTGTNYSLINSYPTSIIWDGTYWWIADANTFIFSGSVQKYDASFNWLSQIGLDTEDSSPQSIELAQGYFWMAGAVNGKVYQYDGPNPPPPPPPQQVPEFSITTLSLAVLTAGGL
ncbi:MAG: hypothetical protein NTW67_05220, partial [Candidatus Woesearchaeota archaeon]|nr:hypothetical protein [Candidatus Woesearchaeota archaeon]